MSEDVVIKIIQPPYRTEWEAESWALSRMPTLPASLGIEISGQLFAAEEFGGLSVRPVSVEAAKGDVLEGTRLGAGEPHLQHVIPSRETEGFKRLGANLSVLPWLAALNKKGCGSRESMDWQAKSSN
jgi:hypothetical protein